MPQKISEGQNGAGLCFGNFQKRKNTPFHTSENFRSVKTQFRVVL